MLLICWAWKWVYTDMIYLRGKPTMQCFEDMFSWKSYQACAHFFEDKKKPTKKGGIYIGWTKAWSNIATRVVNTEMAFHSYFCKLPNVFMYGLALSNTIDMKHYVQVHEVLALTYINRNIKRLISQGKHLSNTRMSKPRCVLN